MLEIVFAFSVSEKGDKGNRGERGPKGVQGRQGHPGPAIYFDTGYEVITIKGEKVNFFHITYNSRKCAKKQSHHVDHLPKHAFTLTS